MHFMPTDIYYFILVVPAFLLSLLAQWWVKSTFRQYSRVVPARQLTGMGAARAILDSQGLYSTSISPVQGELTDHYVPASDNIRLSQATYGVSSVAAVGVAAHEAGHAIQYNTQYFPIQLRQAVIPVSRYGSMLSWPVLIIGFLLESRVLILTGIVLFSLAALFQLLTLPVELNASKRAMRGLENSGLLLGEELTGAKKVLTAAALTYVAALAVSLMSILRLVLRMRNSR